MPSLTSSRAHVAVVLLGLVAGCSSTQDEPAERALRVVHGAPSLPDDAELTSYDAQGVVRATGAAGDLLLVGTDSGAFHLDGSALAPLEIWSDAPNAPTSTGAVRLVSRHDGALLVLAETGLYYSFGPRLIPSEASEQVMGLGVVAIAPHGDDLWLVTDQGVAQLSGGALSWLEIPGEDEAPTAVLRRDELLVVAHGERVYEVDLATEQFAAMPYLEGEVTALSAGVDDSIYVATTAGLFERLADGTMVHHTLVAEGAAPDVAVLGLGYYPKDGTFALTADGVLLAARGEVTGARALPASAEATLSADDLGRLWIGDGPKVTTVALGTPISFADDVAPVLQTYCAGCHGEGTQGATQLALDDVEVVRGLSATILARIQSGQMPPAGFEPVPGDAADLLQRWTLSGMNP